MAPNTKTLKKASSSSPSILDWSSLPDDILASVLDKLVSLADYVRVSAVCVPWCSVALYHRRHWLPTRIHHQLPLLIIPNPHTTHHMPSLYSVTGSSKVHDFLPAVPCGSNKRFIGSSLGWLMFIDNNFVITLFNPFSKSAMIHLPPTPVLEENLSDDVLKHEYYVTKAILSTDPASNRDDYVVMIIFTNLQRLAFIKPSRNSRWTCLQGDYMDRNLFQDVTYFNDQFHAVDIFGRVRSLDVSLEVPKTHLLVRSMIQSNHHHPMTNTYIVHSCLSRKILQIRRFSNWDKLQEQYHTVGFIIYEFDDNLEHWVKKRSLGDEVLFVGDNHSISVLASDFPGCHPGSIYYTASIRLFMFRNSGPIGPRDIGIYNVKDECFEPHFAIEDISTQKAMISQTPIWVVPTYHDAGAKKPDLLHSTLLSSTEGMLSCI